MNDFLEKFGQYKECEFIYKGHDYFFNVEQGVFRFVDNEKDLKTHDGLLRTFKTLEEMVSASLFDGRSFKELIDNEIKIVFYG